MTPRTRPDAPLPLPLEPARWELRAARRLASLLPTWRRSPATVTYLCVLLTTYWVTFRLLPLDQAERVFHAVSTNLDNLQHHPVRSLLGSALFPATPLLSVPGVLTLGVGIAGCLGWIERTHGTGRALAALAIGHFGATLVTAPVVMCGIVSGRYDPAEAFGFDFGISYAAVAAMAAVTGRLPGLLRPLWLLSGVGYVLSTAEWYGLLPDFTTIGHLSAVALGCMAARLLGLDRRRVTGRG
ncbi:rhomboid-like protein [Kitasatospora sp. NPDC093102]|uniref:rhomboid-like protein n=1 Tax=Kitasatospora sp. NPDC093102 TaxID=3155069 RepID=UPI00342DA1CD